MDLVAIFALINMKLVDYHKIYLGFCIKTGELMMTGYALKGLSLPGGNLATSVQRFD